MSRSSNHNFSTGNLAISSIPMENIPKSTEQITTETELQAWIYKLEDGYPAPSLIFLNQLRNHRGELVDSHIMMAKLLCGPLQNTTIVPLGNKNSVANFLKWSKEPRVVTELSRKHIRLMNPSSLEITRNLLERGG